MSYRRRRFRGKHTPRSVLKTGQRARGKGLSLSFRSADKHRLAVIVSKKVSKKAVVRNRIRRRVYAELETIINTTQTPQELVVTIYDLEFATMPVSELKQRLSDVLKIYQVKP